MPELPAEQSLARILNRGPEYFRHRLRDERPGKLSVRERLEADRAKYVKGRIQPSARLTRNGIQPVRRIQDKLRSSEPSHGPTSILALKCSQNLNLQTPFVHCESQKSRSDRCMVIRDEARPPRLCLQPQRYHEQKSPCTDGNGNSYFSEVSWQCHKTNTTTVVKSPHSTAVERDRLNSTASSVDRFFDSCGLAFSFRRGTGSWTGGSSVRWDDPVFDGLSLQSHNGVAEDDASDHTKASVSVVERNARIIKWLFECRSARRGIQQS
uniref:protein FAM110A-like n=1 Tax=Myxine glutinosa TaxID=7769 RepID=UPI00358F8B88